MELPPPPPVLTARGIRKHYGAVAALDGVDLEIHAGETVGLVGDNGAGKSTLVKILSGVIQPSAGEIFVDGKEVGLKSPRVAREQGIETIYQDLALALDLSVVANLFLGREQIRPGLLGRLGWLDNRRMMATARDKFQELNIRLPSIRSECGSLSGGQRQAVAVARAVMWRRRMVLMDEPTAALGVQQQQQVVDLIEQLHRQGVTVLVISHNLPQVCRICHRVVVLRHGRVVGVLSGDSLTVERIVLYITGGATPGGGAGGR
ncbi:MAG: ATP-binding cassette domain-containing protein [Rhodospirillales bacterium]|nr:ATP-binding cassette domain-containing protein [Rhodospirillales bacterium]